MRKDSKKRVCIFVTYDSENIVDDYIGYLLQELCECVNSLIVVCNYAGVIKGFENIKPYADSIFFRNNIGFDAGAYKDALCGFVDWNKLKQFDELVLANDTFYGPFWPLEKMFYEMDGCDADFWSITKHPSGVLPDGRKFDEHFQSYFLVVRKKLLESGLFRKFWEMMPEPKNRIAAIEQFELRFTEFFLENGFSGASLMDRAETVLKLTYNQNPYMYYSRELVSEMKIPFLKKKCLQFSQPGYCNAVDAVEYIENCTEYDVGLIWDNIYRLCDRGGGFYYNYHDMEELYLKSGRIFIYGAGYFGKKVERYFSYRHWKFAGFIQTYLTGNETNCGKFDDMRFLETDGIIIAVSEKYVNEIFKKVLGRIEEKQVLRPETQAVE